MIHTKVNAGITPVRIVLKVAGTMPEYLACLGGTLVHIEFLPIACLNPLASVVVEPCHPLSCSWSLPGYPESTGSAQALDVLVV